MLYEFFFVCDDRFGRITNFFDFSVDHHRAKQTDFGGNDGSEHLARGDFYHPNISHEDLGTLQCLVLEILEILRYMVFHAIRNLMIPYSSASRALRKVDKNICVYPRNIVFVPFLF